MLKGVRAQKGDAIQKMSAHAEAPKCRILIRNDLQNSNALDTHGPSSGLQLIYKNSVNGNWKASVYMCVSLYEYLRFLWWTWATASWIQILHFTPPIQYRLDPSSGDFLKSNGDT